MTALAWLSTVWQALSSDDAPLALGVEDVTLADADCDCRQSS